MYISNYLIESLLIVLSKLKNRNVFLKGIVGFLPYALRKKPKDLLWKLHDRSHQKEKENIES